MLFQFQEGPRLTLHSVCDPVLTTALITESLMSPDARDKEGNTPLVTMAALSHFPCGIALIINGANIDAPEEVSRVSNNLQPGPTN